MSVLTAPAARLVEAPEEPLLQESITALEWSPGGRSLFAATASGELARIDDCGRIESEWSAHRGAIFAISLRPAGGCLASGGEDGTIRLWDCNTEQGRIAATTERWVEHLAWAPRGRMLAAAAGRRLLIQEGERLALDRDDFPSTIAALGWSVDGQYLASGVYRGVYLLRRGQSRPVKAMEFAGAAAALAWGRDSRALAVGTQDKLLHILKRSQNAAAKQLTMRGYPGKVMALAWHPRQHRLASAGGKDIVIWDVYRETAGRVPQVLGGHEQTVVRLAYGGVRLWEASGACRQVQPLDAEVTALAWSPGGRQLAAGTRTGRVRLLAVTHP